MRIFWSVAYLVSGLALVALAENAHAGRCPLDARMRLSLEVVAVVAWPAFALIALFISNTEYPPPPCNNGDVG